MCYLEPCKGPALPLMPLKGPCSKLATKIFPQMAAWCTGQNLTRPIRHYPTPIRHMGRHFKRTLTPHPIYPTPIRHKVSPTQGYSVNYCQILSDDLSDTVGYCRILSDTVRYCRILSDTVGYCRILSDTVGYSRIQSDTVGYCQIVCQVDLAGLKVKVLSFP